MIEAPASATPARRTRKRRRWGISLILLVFLVTPLGLYCYGWYVRHVGFKELEAVTAELDAAEPGWRMADLEKSRAVIPPEENGALVVLAAEPLMPKEWPVVLKGSEAVKYVALGHVIRFGAGAQAASPLGVPIEALVQIGDVARAPIPNTLWSTIRMMDFSEEMTLVALSPEVQFNEKQTTWLRFQMQQSLPALAKAHKLTDMSRGRYKVEWNLVNPLYTSLEHALQVMRVARLLQYETMLLAQDGDIEAACLTTRATINTGRSIGDELCIITALTRIAGVGYGIRSVERSLAQGQPSETSLKTLQALLEMEERELPELEIMAFRGERAMFHILFDNMDTGVYSMIFEGSPGNSSLFARLANPTEFIADQKMFVMAPSIHAAYLRRMTKHIESCNLPFGEQEREMLALEAADYGKQVHALASLPTSALSKSARAFLSYQARLRCAIVALAAERLPSRIQGMAGIGQNTRQVEFAWADAGRPLRWQAHSAAAHG